MMTEETRSKPHADQRSFRMPDQTTLGPPTLRVRDLQSTLRFYENDLGLIELARFRDPTEKLEMVPLGLRNSNTTILILKHDPIAKRTPHNFAGLYHSAVLVPDRKSLASTYLAIANAGVVYDGFANHGFSEALYLHDEERNGIEIYSDRPRNVWPEWKRVLAAFKAGDPGALDVMGRPLDIESLIRELDTRERDSPAWFPRDAQIGHMHLRVTNLERSVRFYHEKLGFDIGAYLPEIGAAFLTIAGYHHRLGLNTWHSHNGKTHEKGEAGLENFHIRVPNQTSIDELSRLPGASANTKEESQVTVLDPDGIEVHITAA
jgi:catechol 2,3-dioxygenase